MTMKAMITRGTIIDLLFCNRTVSVVSVYDYMPMRISWTICLLLAGITALSQEDCSHVPSPKAEKLLSQSRDTKKYSADERLALLDKSLEEDPECLACLIRAGEIKFLRSKRTGAPFAEAKQHLEKLMEICPDYHSETYYFLGAMSYADREYDKALDYFEKFLRFPDDDPTKVEKDYEKKYEEVKEAMETVREYAEIYKDPIEYNPRKVAGVSSDVDDYLPLISPDGEIMFITRKRYKQAKGDFEPRLQEEFVWCRRPEINALFDAGEPLPEPFNLGDNYGGATISVDNKELIIAKKNPQPKNPQNIDLFTARFQRTTDKSGRTIYQWDELKDIGSTVNTPDGWEGQPSLSGDGQTLYFVGVRPECLKDEAGNFTHDIFVSERQPDGTWGQCRPLPPPINTRMHEKAPFMHSDSKTLYFASNGHTGVGGLDIFYCRSNEDGSFTKPKNLGYPINNEEDQLGIVVSSDGELAYFGANKLNGGKGWDVFEFRMPEKARPERIAIIKGEVKDDAGEPAQQAEVEIKYAQSGESEKVKVNSDDGSYAAVVKIAQKEDVLLQVKGEGIAFNSRIIARKTDPEPPVVLKLNMETMTAGEDKPFVINDIRYSTNRAEIEESSQLILDEFALYLNEHVTMEIEIRGHTDNVGNDQANLALSKERAFEVLNYLVSKGVDASRMSYQGFGKSKPVASNDTEEGRALNRRTEFRIRKM